MTYPPQPEYVPAPAPAWGAGYAPPPYGAEPVGPLHLSPQHAAPAKRPRGLIIGIVAGAAVVAVAASAGTAAMLMSGGPVKTVAAKVAAVTASTLVVNGTLTLHDEDLSAGLDGCGGQGGYSDINAGADVTVTDGAGAIVGLGHLGSPDQVGSEDCSFPFSVSDVPAGKGFYGVEVSHRGSLKYAEADLASPLELTLGS